MFVVKNEVWVWSKEIDCEVAFVNLLALSYIIFNIFLLLTGERLIIFLLLTGERLFFFAFNWRTSYFIVTFKFILISKFLTSKTHILHNMS